MLTSRLLQGGSSGCPPPRLITVTNGFIPVGNTNLSNFPASTICGYTKSLKNENNDMQVKLVDVEDGPLSERQLEEIFCEIWNTDKEVLLAYREGARIYPRIQPHKTKNGTLELPPGTDRFQLILPESKSICDLQFGPLDTPTLKENEVEVQIKAFALNFRDVLSVIKPSDQFKDINSVGFDMAGVVKRVGTNVTKWKVGDRVCGCNMNYSALPSHFNVKENLLIRVEPHMTLCEAATLPAVYMTSVVCLLEVAKIKKEDVVLLHTASGGVGLSAIEICKHVGCTIIATAGSKRKQNYLKSLGIKHIFHSRNTQYGDQILKVTNGRGVDVVLNSLTSEGFKEATLKACAKGARFIEMSKLNIWKPEEVKQLRPDVDFTIVDVSSSDDSEWNRLMEILRDLMEKDVVQPIPYVRFDALNIREALQYMQKAKHIGKIVCTMPELRNKGGEIKVHTPMFNDASSYLITGGLGGIGFEVCKWMLDNGAKHVVLASRSLPTTSMNSRIKEMNSTGANVITIQLDVGDFQQCKELIEIKMGGMGLPPLRGVMHAAGIIADALIPNMDWPKLSSTFSTKINGSLNLHELTKNLSLEHFVVFSSMAAILGPPGQCNHAAGNAFEDALVHYRNSLGLPGTTVNWGQWGEVGVATEVDLPGLKTLSNVQGISGLEYTMKLQHTQLAVINIESFRMLSKLFPHLAVYLDENVWKSSGASSSVTIKSEEFWQQYESKPELEEKLLVVKAQLKNILKGVLKLDEAEDINENANFQEMGVDSLMFIEIKNSLQSLLGNRITVNAASLKDSNTVNLLAETLVKLIVGDNEMAETDVKPTADEVNELIREDCILPEDIGAKLGQTVGNVRDVERVLVAGATGTMGLYVLKELSNSPQITEVICLMRKINNETPDERLRRVLINRELLPEVNIRKVRCVSGNVALPNLGLEKDVWKELSESVDAVFNCSARVQHNELYRKRSSTTDVRAVNIGGTKNLLKFACERKLKHFYQGSSLLSVLKIDETSGQVSEEWPNAQDYDGVTTFAYPISKHVGDVLARQAMERGIPCKVFRLPLITGESKTGRCAPENNHALLRYLFILKNGIMASTPFPIPMLPVDFCAEVSLRIFLDERAPADIYNVGNAKVNLDQEFVDVAKRFGYHVDIVELTEFLTRVKEAAQQDPTSALNMFAEMYSDEDALLSSFANAPIIQRWVEGNEGIFGSTKVPALIPNFYENQRSAMDYIYENLMFLKGKGWFEKFGL